MADGPNTGLTHEQAASVYHSLLIAAARQALADLERAFLKHGAALTEAERQAIADCCGHAASEARSILD